jgi:hypothetical protein
MMTVAPPLVLFSNPDNTDPTYSKFGSSLQQDSHFRCPTHADRDVSANLRLAPEVACRAFINAQKWSLVIE